MGVLDGLLALLDTRSFSSLWYWLLLAGIWSWVGRGALGIPSDLVRAVHRKADEQGADVLLLDWVSLVTPRWRVMPRDGAILVGIGSFVLSVLAALGFIYDLQMAQALFLLLAPLLLLAVLRVRLASRLGAELTAAEAGQREPGVAAAGSARLIVRHMRHATILSVLAVAGAAMWGTRWLALHPNGM